MITNRYNIKPLYPSYVAIGIIRISGLIFVSPGKSEKFYK